MKIIYDSLTGQGERFANKLGYETIPVFDYDNEEGPFLLITRSYDFGQVPDDVVDFLDNHADKVVGVAACGNRNWGDNFGAAGDKIKEQYGIELVHKFEGSGFPSDVEIVKEWIETHE